MSTATSRTMIPRSNTASKRLRATLMNTAVREFLAEFIGTFVLVAVGDACIATYLLKERGAKVDPLPVCFCFGIGALVGISASMNISGGHINPAVTVALAVLKKFPWSKVWYYVISQYLGGFFASAVVHAMYAEAINFHDDGVRSAYGNATSTGGIFATYPMPYVTILGSFVDQVIGTAFLLFAVTAITDDNNIKVPPPLKPLALGFMITAVCTAFSLNCGAILNPARDLAPRLWTTVAGYGWEPFQPLGGHYWWVCGVLGPHVGAIIGVIIYIVTIDQQSLFLEIEAIPTDDNLRSELTVVGGQMKETSVNSEKQPRITTQSPQYNAITIS